jgi:hypothetical protein
VPVGNAVPKTWKSVPSKDGIKKKEKNRVMGEECVGNWSKNGKDTKNLYAC